MSFMDSVALRVIQNRGRPFGVGRRMQVTPEKGFSCTSLVDRIAGNGKGVEEDESLRGAAIQWHTVAFARCSASKSS